MKQVENMLSDTNTYELLKKDPTEKIKEDLKTLLKLLLKEEKVSDNQYHSLIPTSNIVPRLYCTQNIHKKQDPMSSKVDSS